MDGQFMNYGKDAPHPFARTQPLDDAPPASAPYEERAAWSEHYVMWYLSRLEHEEPPLDARATHLYEIEFAVAVENPQAYERVTRQELSTTHTLH